MSKVHFVVKVVHQRRSFIS